MSLGKFRRKNSMDRRGASSSKKCEKKHRTSCVFIGDKGGGLPKGGARRNKQPWGRQTTWSRVSISEKSTEGGGGIKEVGNKLGREKIDVGKNPDTRTRSCGLNRDSGQREIYNLKWGQEQASYWGSSVNFKKISHWWRVDIIQIQI